MLRSLHARLTTALLLLLLFTGAVNLFSTLLTTRLYMNEVVQNLNVDLAKNIASLEHRGLVDAEGQLDREGVERLLHWMMVVNPGSQFYILDLRGRILAFDPTSGEPALDGVSLAPIHAAIDRSRLASRRGPREPIYGDDPRDPETPKVFSVSPLPPTARPIGYLYIVLQSQPYESVAESLRGSYILRLGLRNGAAYLALALTVGLVASFVLTRPLRRLAKRMEGFQVGTDDSRHGEPARSAPGLATTPAPPRLAPSSEVEGDEVRLLETRFEEMAERLRLQMDDLEHLSDLRLELMTNLSHDLRTPIATLRGYLETLALRDGVLGPEQRESYLAIALRHSERLSRLVDELLELSKLDRTEMRPELERFHLGELVSDNLQRFRLRAEQAGIHLAADFDTDLPPVYADVRLMERALENLVDNALRHTQAGGRVTVRLRERADRLEVSVLDTGSGIAEADLPLIFNRFYRSNQAASSENVGLGLAITQRIAELHGGELEVRSELGRGSVFAFGLAIAPRTYQMSTAERSRLSRAFGRSEGGTASAREQREPGPQS